MLKGLSGGWKINSQETVLTFGGIISFHPDAEVELNASVDYYQRDNDIIILAVMQLHKKPNYWKERKIQQVRGDQ